MQASLTAFSEWLASTPFSVLIATTSWVIPSVQSIHILSIAVVMSSALVISLRVLGWVMSDWPIGEVVQRFLPWIWFAVTVLLITGAVLIIAEPERSLPNTLFQLKMALLLGVIVCMILFQRPLKRDAAFWDSTPRARVGAKVVAVVSMALWIGIVFAGRWIAYAGGGV